MNDSTPGDPRLAGVIRMALERRAAFETTTVRHGGMLEMAEEIVSRYGSGRCHAFTRAVHAALYRLDIPHEIVALRDSRSNIFHSAVLINSKLLLDATGLIPESYLLERFEGRMREMPFLARVHESDLERYCSGFDQMQLDQAVEDLWEVAGILEQCPAQRLSEPTV